MLLRLPDRMLRVSLPFNRVNVRRNTFLALGFNQSIPLLLCSMVGLLQKVPAA
jgi:hypothetical protein